MERIVLSVTLFAVLAACGIDAESREDSGSLPVAREAPVRPVQAGPEPTVPSAAPARAIPPGTLLTFEVQEEVSTASHDAGDSFRLVLVRAVNGSGGAVLAAGTPGQGVVTHAYVSAGAGDSPLLVVRVSSVEAAGTQRPIGGQLQSTVLQGSRASNVRTAATLADGPEEGTVNDQILVKGTRIVVRLQRALVF